MLSCSINRLHEQLRLESSLHERLCFPPPLFVFGLDVDTRGRQGAMTHVLLDRWEPHAVTCAVRSIRVPQPMRAGSLKAAIRLGILAQCCCDVCEKILHEQIDRLRCDRLAWAVQAAD